MFVSHHRSMSFLSRCLKFSRGANSRSFVACVGCPRKIRERTYRWYDDEVEHLDGYSEGGYHPVQIGDLLADDRYRVVHKLGFGASSTVWLAKDRIQNRYVSMKIFVAYSSADNSELKIQKHLQSLNHEHHGRTRIVGLLDDFEINGPNGRHLCMVNEFVGPTVQAIKETMIDPMFSVEKAKHSIAQLAVGLSYIHSCGIVHGDIRANSIVSQLPDLVHHWTEEQVYYHLGKPTIEKIERSDNKPTGPEAPLYAVHPATYWEMHFDFYMKNIKIADFKNSFFEQDHKKGDLEGPIERRAPESFFNEVLNQRADIWPFACTAFDLLGSWSLFDQFAYNSREMMNCLIPILGPLPPEWEQKWNTLPTFFHATSETLHKPPPHPKQPTGLSPLIREIRARPAMTAKDVVIQPLNSEETSQVEDLLTGCLKYRPAERMSAKKIVELDWLKKALREGPEKVTMLK